MSFPVPFYLAGGPDTPLGDILCPNGQTTAVIGPDQERILLAFCEPTGKSVLLQPLNTTSTTAGICLQKGETQWFYWDIQGPLTALGWQVRNDSGGDVRVSVAYVRKKGWRYPP